MRTYVESSSCFLRWILEKFEVGKRLFVVFWGRRFECVAYVELILLKYFLVQIPATNKEVWWDYNEMF